jgi:drug/metabolite transporter (DMT)-like permease
MTPVSWAGLVYLTVAGSIIAFTAYVWLMDHVQAPLVATHTFVKPIVAVLLGWAALGEHMTLQMGAGFGIVFASVVWLSRLEAA